MLYGAHRKSCRYCSHDYSLGRSGFHYGSCLKFMRPSGFGAHADMRLAKYAMLLYVVNCVLGGAPTL